ncbi:MAG: type II secretion system minor pseudopilin GspH [Betaproteobacteria bacterium]|nr:type II secretion system minor pseudopilin GspH [Betaproteobacteria bacterium]
MRKSAPGSTDASPPGRGTGFTLIELLVVLAIVGIMVGVAAVRLMPDPSRRLEDSARRLAALLEQAREEALITGSSIGWSQEGGGYAFWQRDGTGRWALDAARVFRARELPPGVRIVAAQADGAPLAGGSRIVFAAQGIGLPFRLTLALAGRRVSVACDGRGAVRLGGLRGQ